MASPSTAPSAALPNVTENSSAPVEIGVPAAAQPAQKQQLDVESDARSTATTPDPFVNDISVVISKPKTTAELIAARATKRAERRTAVREKAEGHRQAGELLTSQKNYKAACTHYQEATQLWASNVDYLIALAGVYRNLEWYEEAAHSATKALTLDPKNLEARYIRGIARLEQRLLLPAKVDFDSVLAHDSDHLRARAALDETNRMLHASTHLGGHSLGPSPVDAIVKDVDFGFPKYEEAGLELASVSDSSDAHHVGNGVQCRFYNHEGCARGAECTFSHAPDEKSVRDDLGKNVCTYYLLDMCKFGATKCIYSHSKAALPQNTSTGWWTSPEKIAKVKAVMELAEKNAKEQRALEKERWKEYLRSRKTASGGGKGKATKSSKSQQQEEKAPNTGDAVAAGDEKTPVAEVAEQKEAAPSPAQEGNKRKPRPPQANNRRTKTNSRGHGRRSGGAGKTPAGESSAVSADSHPTSATVEEPKTADPTVPAEEKTASGVVNGAESVSNIDKSPVVAGAEKATEEKSTPPTESVAKQKSSSSVETEKVPPPAPTKKAGPGASGPGFVDYELNVPPAGVKPIVHQTDDPITLPY